MRIVALIWLPAIMVLALFAVVALYLGAHTRMMDFFGDLTFPRLGLSALLIISALLVVTVRRKGGFPVVDR